MFAESTTVLPTGFPKGEPAFTNRNVIVASNYVSLLNDRDPVPGQRPDAVQPSSLLAAT